jgi:hypothetical protein
MPTALFLNRGLTLKHCVFISRSTHQSSHILNCPTPSILIIFQCKRDNNTRKARLNDIRSEENALNAILSMCLSIDGAETSESNAGFRRHFNYKKCTFNQNF